MPFERFSEVNNKVLDVDSDSCEAPTNMDRWSRYVLKYSSGEDTVSNELKEQLANKPVFLPRNVRTWRAHAARKHNEIKGSSDECLNACVTLNNLHDMDLENKIDLNCLEDDSAGEAVKGLVELNAKAIMMDRARKKKLAEGAHFKFSHNSYKMLFVVHSETYLCKRMALKRAHQSHQKLSLRLNKKFHAWHKLWLEENVTSDHEKIAKSHQR